jgi:hypothetical protein
MTNAAPVPNPAPLVKTAPLPIPRDPAVPQAILDLAAKPLFKVSYTGTEQATVRKGLPLFGEKGVANREVAFTNEFGILKTSGPMVSYAAATLDDAMRSARQLAFDWSDPSIGGAINASVGVAILQHGENQFFHALIGSGKTNTSASALGYRSDRYDNNINGRARLATDLKAVSGWSAPVDKKGNAVNIPAPSNDRPVVAGRVRDIKADQIDSVSTMVKAIVDVNKVLMVGVEDK